MRQWYGKYFKLQTCFYALLSLTIFIFFLTITPLAAKADDESNIFLFLRHINWGFSPGGCNPNWEYLISQANHDSKVVNFSPSREYHNIYSDYP